MVGGNMKISALQKDFLMEIKKSKGRFLSIFFIVALGVSLFSGIRVSQTDMILTGDAYVDDSRLMDIKIMSDYGLTQEDVNAVSELPAVERAIGSYSQDVLCDDNGNSKVVRVMSTTEDMNLIDVSDGRLPENDTECLLDQDFMKESGYEIGDTITFLTGDSSELSEVLKRDTYTIVGSGHSPLYFSIDRGSSTIGNGTISGFAVVTEEAFVVDVYTEMYVVAKGSKEAVSFTDEYDQIVEEAIEQIEFIKNTRCETRKNQLIEEATKTLEGAEKELQLQTEQGEKEIAENEKVLEEAELESKLGQVRVESGKAQLETAKAQLEASKKTLEENRDLYEQAMSALETQKAALEQELVNLEEKAEALSEEQKQPVLDSIEQIRVQLDEIQAEINKITSQFDEKLASGEKEIAESEAKLKEQERMLQQAEKEIKVGNSDIESGKQQLDEAKNTMNEQIESSEKQLQEAKEEINQISLPTWYVFDRSVIPEYTGYRDNADRMAALSVVFPTIFFLVAALISLTSMTRMIEEQRTQIGTLKALGYHKFSILKKYLYYAMLATVGGSLLGILIGEKLFPYVIIVSYKIMYSHIPHIVVPYDWKYGMIAMGIAVLCTGIATIASCYHELAVNPATLMRPAAPKIGKRVFIENITFIWKRLNFSWKSTIRNLFRYKKRFFMTLFGIGGCMGLLLVGFGLRDSIGSIAVKQFEEIQTYDASVFLSDETSQEEIAALDHQFETEKAISKYTRVRMESTMIQNEEEEVDAYLVVIHDLDTASSFFTYQNRLTKETYTLADEGAILSEKTAKMLGADVGDVIYLTTDGEEKKQIRIDAICENYVGHYIYLTSNYYEELYGETPFYNNYLIQIDGTQEQMEEIGEEILSHDSVLNVQYTESLIEQLDNMLTALDAVMVILVVVAGMLSFVVLYNLNTININERRRELASLKVLGFYNLEVAEYVYRENVLLTILGILVGCVIGKFLHLFTIVTVEVDAAMFGREIFGTSYLWSALLTLLFSAFVNWMMYFKLKKIDMVESLKSVE